MARWHPEAEIYETGDLLMVAGADSYPVGYSNSAVPLGSAPGASPELALNAARDFFGDLGRGFTFWTRSHIDARLADYCRQAGLQAVGESPAMVLDEPIHDDQRQPAGSLEYVQDEAGFRDFVSVVGRAYETSGVPPESTAAALGYWERMLGPDVIAGVARLDGEAVAAALALLSHGVGGIYWVGTVPEHRSRGLGETCTRFVGNAAFDQGAAFLVLVATKQGVPLYRRMGYRDVASYVANVDFGR